LFIIDLFRRNWVRKKIESSEDFKASEKFAADLKVKEEVDYGWVERHALEEFRLCESRIDKIESKADSLIKYLGAGSGIAALLAAHAPAAQVIPTLLLLLAALFVAIRALQPGEHPSLPKTKLAFEFAEYHKPKEATACFAAKINAASVGMAISARNKADCVRWAFWFFLMALVWLVGYAAYSAISAAHFFA
jgi:hypothetical protein